jgi:tRNA (cmo5U34)-methyltransferase
MKSSGDDFDSIAHIYDTLSNLVFLGAVREAQHAFLNNVSENDRVLVLGGGTGRFLPALKARIGSGQVLFVDSSSRMISLASKQVLADEQLIFLKGTLDDVPPTFAPNVVITHFFLDLFDDRQLDEVIKKIKSHTGVNSKWIACDFVNTGPIWQRILLKTMYIFFKIFAKLRNQALPDWYGALIRNGYLELGRQEFYRRFIRACVFERKRQGQT